MWSPSIWATSGKGLWSWKTPLSFEVVYGKLKQHVGRPLTEIGDLEISLLPPMPKRGPRQVRPPAPIRYKSVVR